MTQELAPDFTLPRDGGNTVTLTGFRPKNVVLFFYPKDDTSGCTVESLAFTALKDEFAAANTVVLGVSKDSVQSHDKFRDKHALDVVLLSDTDGLVCEAYGVWAEKTNYGKKYMGIVPSTFLIDGTGHIVQSWKNVKVKGHAEQVLEAAQQI